MMSYEIIAITTLLAVATGAPVTDTAVINFAPSTVDAGGGDFRDHGLTYRAQDGYDYGWTCDTTANSRNTAGNDFWNTFIIPDRNNNCEDTSWDLSVVNGEYDVEVYYCDSRGATDTQGCSVEGVSASLGVLPQCSGGNDETWSGRTWSGRVTVKDGKLTFGGEWASGCVLISGIKVTRVPPTIAPGTISSAQSCHDLGWDEVPAIESDPNVCGYSNPPVSGSDISGCSGLQTYEAAVGFCTALGARLCTIDELIDSETANTGCGYDSQRIWSSSACADGSRSTIGGNPANPDVYVSFPQQCDSETEKRYTRCCADTVPFNWEITGGAQTEINIYEARVFSPMYIGSSTIVAAEDHLEAGDPAAGAAQVDVLCSADTSQTLDFYAFAGNPGDDSFFMEMLPYGTSLDWHIHNSGSWKWETGTSGASFNAYKYPLQAGRNILRITERESMARVGKVRFEDDTCVQVDPISYSPCVAGQGEASGAIADHAGNSLEWCRAKCDTNPACGAFDISVTLGSCRLYATGNAARIGEAGTDNRQYCEQTTAAPTAAPTSAPPSFAALMESDLSASVGVLLGAVGDTVYKCGYVGPGDFLCTKNLLGARHTWVLVDSSESDSVVPQDSVTTSDGAWTVDPISVTFTSNNNADFDYVWPNTCDCPI